MHAKPGTRLGSEPRTAPPHPPPHAHALTQLKLTNAQRHGKKRATTQAARREEDAEQDEAEQEVDAGGM